MNTREQLRTIAAAAVVLTATATATCAKVEQEGTGGGCDAGCPAAVQPADCPALATGDLAGRCNDKLAGSVPELLERDACVSGDCYPRPGALFVTRVACGGPAPLTVEIWCAPGGP